MGWLAQHEDETTPVVTSLAEACARLDAQAIEHGLVRLLDPKRPPPPAKAMGAARAAVYAGTLHLARLQKAWRARRDQLTLVHVRHLQAAVEEAKDAIDAKMRGAALQHIAAAREAAEAHLKATFTVGNPCPCLDPQLPVALEEAGVWQQALAWTSLQRKVWIGLAQTLNTAVQLNLEGAGKEGRDRERGAARNAVRAALADADQLLATVPLKAEHSKDHVMLEGQARRTRAVLAELDRYGEAEWAARRAARPHTEGAGRSHCEGCGAAFGWLRLQWRHPCAQCGHTFCSGCLGHTKPLPSLAYTDPVRVCGKCSLTPPPAGPRPPIPDMLRGVGAKSIVYKPTVLAELY